MGNLIWKVGDVNRIEDFLSAHFINPLSTVARMLKAMAEEIVVETDPNLHRLSDVLYLLRAGASRLSEDLAQAIEKDLGGCLEVAMTRSDGRNVLLGVRLVPATGPENPSPDPDRGAADLEPDGN